MPVRDIAEARRMPSGEPLSDEAVRLHCGAADYIESIAKGMANSRLDPG
jgi:hypothetical protein